MIEDQETAVDTGESAYVPGSVIPAIIDGGTWAASFGLSWSSMMLYDQATSQRIIRPNGQYFRKVSGTMGVAAARSEAAAYFLKTDAEWLLMIDTDMGFEMSVVDRMVDSAVANGVPILGALCFAQKVDSAQNQGPNHAIRYRIQPTLYRYVEVTQTGERGFQSITKYKRDAYQEVAATGAALLLIHRSALEAVGPEPFMPITDPAGGGNGTPRTFSEDLSFCVRAQSAGLAMGVDTSIKTSHYKGGIFLDEVAFAMQQETLVQAKGHAIARQAETYMRQGLIVPGHVR
jgi:hypothetical protein